MQVTMDASEVDFQTPGKYTVTYKAGTDKISKNVYLYGPISLTYNGQVVDTVELTFAEAMASKDFMENVQMLDSFGNALEVKKVSGSALFQYAEGTYEVVYEAYDRAGQGQQKKLIYKVTGNAGMSVETDKTAKYTDSELKLAVDLAGQTEVFLADGSGRIGPDEYKLADGTLTIYGAYLQTLGPGEKTLRLCSQAGSCEVKFTVTGEGERVSAPTFGIDGAGSTLGWASVAGYGSCRDYRAKNTNSWSNRMFFKGVNPKVHGTICLDIYIYQSKILNSSGKLEDSKDGLAQIPFSVSTMSGEKVSYLFVDKETGQVVPTEELKMKTWYTLRINVANLTKSTDVPIYLGVSNKWQARAYVANIKCYAPEKATNTTVYADEANTVTICQKGGQCTFTQTTYDGEQVFLYTTGNRYLPSMPAQRTLQIELREREKQIIRFQFKVLSATDANGAVVTPMMFVSDTLKSEAPKCADYVIVDETGTPVATAEVGKWYTVYISTDNQRFFNIYPMGASSSQYQVRMLIRDLTTETAEFTQPFTTAEANYCSSGMYKNANGEWTFACASYTGIWGDNTAWRRRVTVDWEDQTQYTKLQLEFMYSASNYAGAQALSLASSVDVTVTDETGAVLDVQKLEVGKWYTATFEVGGGLNLPASFDIYPMGYYDGSVKTPVEMAMSLRNITFS